MSRLFAGFIKAERDRELVTIPAYCVADDEMHARKTLASWARERWAAEKGWRCQQGWCREISTEALLLDERIMDVAVELIKRIELEGQVLVP